MSGKASDKRQKATCELAASCMINVRKEWDKIPQAAQMDLWLAPTKGGVFTTVERDTIKSKLPKVEA